MDIHKAQQRRWGQLGAVSPAIPMIHTGSWVAALT